jgi:hypothetical protein
VFVNVGLSAGDLGQRRYGCPMCMRVWHNGRPAGPSLVGLVAVVVAMSACLPTPVSNRLPLPNPTPAPTTTQPAPTTGLPYVNPSLIPARGTRIFTDERVRPTTEAPSPTGDTGSFRIPCSFSYMNYDDPIVFPGQQGRTHLHTFFGNTGTNFASTADSLASTGGSTCRGGTMNRSAYWIPSLIDTREGRPLVPNDAVFYYKSAHMNPAEIAPLPSGLRMIVGHSTNTTQPTSHNSFENPYFWYCSAADGTTRVSVTGGYRPTVLLAAAQSEHQLPAVLGRSQSRQRDHKSHLFNGGGNTCPSSHPVKLVQISIGFSWPVPAGATSATMRLSSDSYSSTQPGGYSTHADWFNGWKPDITRAWTTSCLNAAADCHAHLLGDGREFY